MTPALEYVRTLTAEDLPSLDLLPEGTDPLAEGVLMQHQKEWLQDRSDLKLCRKGRRTGITWSEALDDTVTVASSRAAGGDNVFYIGDTKEKGLEFIATCAQFAQILAGHNGAIDEVLFEDQQPDGSTRKITAYRIRFASGFQVLALSSRPAGIRGLQGIVVIDEAAFHADVQGVIDAANALIIWGGKIRIISTHNGARNPFNQLILDTLAGQYAYSLHTITFDDAVRNGLYERVALVKGWTPSPEGKGAWYRRVRGTYGANRAAMLEELDVIPRESAGKAIPGIWIENAMREVRPVLRWILDDDFEKLPEAERTRLCSRWIDEHLKALLKLLKEREHVFGMDFARRRHLSVIAPLSIEPDLTRRAPFLIELHKVPSRQQEQILWTVIDALPRRRGGAIDASGPGLVLAEYTADRYGRPHIQEVTLTDAWYRDHMGLFVQAFEDGKLDLPRDADVASDLRALETDIHGIVKVPHIEDIGANLTTRHGDTAIALALGYFASVSNNEVIAYHRVPRAPSDPYERTVRTTHGVRASNRRGIL